MAEQNSISGEPSGIGRIDGLYQLAEECPLRRVLAIREHGLVVEATRSFEVGSAMMLGCHVDRRGGAACSNFISAEVIVVESRQMLADGNRYQVTVLFSEISCEDREILQALPSADGIRLSRSQSQNGSHGAAQRTGLAIPPPEVFLIPLASPSCCSPATPAVEKGGAELSAGQDVGVGSKGQSGCSLN
jgi:hypothetical protein